MERIITEYNEGAYNPKGLIKGKDGFKFKNTATEDLYENIGDTSWIIKRLANKNITPYVLDSIASLRLMTNTELGDFIITSNYYIDIVGGSSLYTKVANISQIDDKGSIIIGNDDSVYQLIHNNQIYIEQFGARGDEVTLDGFTNSNTLNIERCFDYCITNNIAIKAGSGVFMIDLVRDAIGGNIIQSNVNINIFLGTYQNFNFKGSGVGITTFKEEDGKVESVDTENGDGRYVKMFYCYFNQNINVKDFIVSDMTLDKNGITNTLPGGDGNDYSWEQAHLFAINGHATITPDTLNYFEFNNVEFVDLIGGGLNVSGLTIHNKAVIKNIRDRDWSAKFGGRGTLEYSALCEDIMMSELSVRYMQIEPVTSLVASALQGRNASIVNSKISNLQYTESDVTILKLTADEENINGTDFYITKNSYTARANQVVNGSFDADPDPTLGWITETGWSIGSGVASSDGTGVSPNGDLIQSGIAALGSYYTLKFTISNYVSGTLTAINEGSVFNSDGAHEIYQFLNSSEVDLILRGDSFIGDIDNVSLTLILNIDVTRNIICADDTTVWLTRDNITTNIGKNTTLPKGSYVGFLEYKVDNIDAEEEILMEVYLTDSNGDPIDSGIVSEAIGDLGVKPIYTLSSGIINTELIDTLTVVELQGTLTEGIPIISSNRYRYHIAFRKEGTDGVDKTFTWIQGYNYENTIQRTDPPALYSFLKVVNSYIEVATIRHLTFSFDNCSVYMQDFFNSPNGAFSNCDILLKSNDDFVSINHFYPTQYKSQIYLSRFFINNCRFIIDSTNPYILPTGYAISNSAKATDLNSVHFYISNCWFDDRLEKSINCYANGSWWIDNCNLVGKENHNAIQVGSYTLNTSIFYSYVKVSNNNLERVDGAYIGYTNNPSIWQLYINEILDHSKVINKINSIGDSTQAEESIRQNVVWIIDNITDIIASGDINRWYEKGEVANIRKLSPGQASSYVCTTRGRWDNSVWKPTKFAASNVLTGIVLDLANPNGLSYNEGTASTSLTFSAENLIVNGNASSLINTATNGSFPSVTVSGGSAVHVPDNAVYANNTDYRLQVYSKDGINIEYFINKLS